MSDTPINGAHFKPDDSAESFFASTPDPASTAPRVADEKYLSARLERDARQGRRRGGRIAICVVAAILVAFIGVFAFTAVTALGHARAVAGSAKSAVSALISMRRTARPSSESPKSFTRLPMGRSGLRRATFPASDRTSATPRALRTFCWTSRRTS